MNKTLLLSVFALTFFSGCATHTSETKDMRAHWNAGNTVKAEIEVSKLAEEYQDSSDALVWLLEKGAVLRGNGNLKTSTEALEKANSLVKSYEAESDVKLSEETAAFLANQSYIPYKGYNYDKIMMGVYLALNYIEQKDFDNARVQIKRLEVYQQNAIEANRKRIERETQALKNASGQKASQQDAAKSLAYNSKEFKQYYGDDNISKVGQQAKSLYVNPFAYWISGVYLLNKGEDSADKERAQDMFRIGGEILGGKSLVFAQDFKRCEDVLSGKPVENITYVIYETGVAPLRNQFRLDLPLFIAGESLPHVAINFPYISPQNSYAADLAIQAGGNSYGVETIADMDSIIKEEFNNELPMVVTKTLLSAAAKASAQYFAAQAAGDWGILVNIVGGVYQSFMNDADLRTWTSLPKFIKVARVQTPADGIITIDNQQIKVSKNPVNIIIAKKMSVGGKLLIRNFDFSNSKEASETVVSTSRK